MRFSYSDGRRTATTFGQGLLLAGVLLLAGCAASDRVVKIYESPDFNGGPFNKILIVAAHEETGTRRFFENSFRTVLNENGAIAVTSLSVMGPGEPIEREPVIAAVRETGADAVLVTRLLDVASTTTAQGGRSTAQAQRRDDLPLADFFRYDYVEYQDPMTTTTASTVVLSSDLYNVADENKIWSAESVSFDKGSVYGVVDSATRGLTNQLRRDQLIR